MDIFSRLSNPLLILYSLPGILLGLVLHELGHALVADRLGDPTPRRMGRISLNPLHHLNPIGTVMLILAGFGWAKPVVTDPRNYRTKRFGFALVGIAGPLTNLILGLILMTVWLLLYKNGTIFNGDVAFEMLSYAVIINFSLCAFNLIPLPPLDGYNILKDSVLLRWNNSRFLWNIERYGQFLLLALLIFPVTSGYISFVVGKLWDLGIWMLTPILGL